MYYDYERGFSGDVYKFSRSVSRLYIRNLLLNPEIKSGDQTLLWRWCNVVWETNASLESIDEVLF